MRNRIRSLNLLPLFFACLGIVLTTACSSLLPTQTLPELVVIPTSTATTTPTTAPITAPITISRMDGSPLQWMDGSNFVYVPEGEFVMGADLPKDADHAPAHTVNLAGFWIQQTEVTNKMYAQCVALGICPTPSRISGTPYWYADSSRIDFPVVGVNWSDAQTYCTWIHGNLPTEAQWEKAARGTEAFLYPWGNTEPTCDLLNYKNCLTPSRSNRVLSYLKGFSLYNAADMAGNISEWVSDWYAADYYSISPASNPTGPGTGTLRVIRGSNYNSLIDALEINLRSSLKPTSKQSDLGFRCVLGGDIPSPAPSCTTTIYIPIPTTPLTPETPREIINLVSAFCEDSYGWVNFDIPDFPVGSDIVHSYDVTSPDGGITCTPGLTSTSLTCLGSALMPGSYATVTICPAQIVTIEGTPACPVGYILDPVDGLCHFDLATAASGPDSCTPSEAWEADYGCVPLAVAGPVPCPPGYYEVFFSDVSLPHECFPFGGARRDANLPCLVGTYVPESDCCQIPDNLTPVCSIGYSYDSLAVTCMPDIPPDACTTFSFYIASCPTPCIPTTCDRGWNWSPTLCTCVCGAACR